MPIAHHQKHKGIIRKFIGGKMRALTNPFAKGGHVKGPVYNTVASAVTSLTAPLAGGNKSTMHRLSKAMSGFGIGHRHIRGRGIGVM